MAAAGPVSVPALLALDLWLQRRARGRLVRDPWQAPLAEAAVVLGARLDARGAPMASLEDRLAAGLALWQAGRVPRVVATGDDGARRQDEAAAMARWLRAGGLPESALVVDAGAYRTLDSMVRLRALGLRRVLLCTQADHLPRSLFLADVAGLDAVGVVADRRRYRGAARSRVYEWVANGKALADAVTLTRPR